MELSKYQDDLIRISKYRFVIDERERNKKMTLHDINEIQADSKDISSDERVYFGIPL